MSVLCDRPHNHAVLLKPPATRPKRSTRSNKKIEDNDDSLSVENNSQEE